MTEDRRTIYAKAIRKVLENPVGVETLDWELADAAIAIADAEIAKLLLDDYADRFERYTIANMGGQYDG